MGQNWARCKQGATSAAWSLWKQLLTACQGQAVHMLLQLEGRNPFNAKLHNPIQA
jgi:hypothetical protein